MPDTVWHFLHATNSIPLLSTITFLNKGKPKRKGRKQHQLPAPFHLIRFYSHSIFIKVFIIYLVDIKCFYFYKLSRFTLFFKLFKVFVVKNESPIYFCLGDSLSSLSPDLLCHFCKTASTWEISCSLFGMYRT